MDDCVFCKIVRGELPSWKVWENALAIAILDLEPITAYHTLVLPKSHYENIFDVPPDILKEVIATTQQVCLLYREKLGIQNIHLLNNNGRQALQSVFHMHIHIIPVTQRVFPGPIQKHPEMMSEYPEMLARLK